VLSRNLVNEEAMAHWGAVAPKTNKQTNKAHSTRKIDSSDLQLWLPKKTPPLIQHYTV
jgi:hypothetical protein